ncbi:hypothetical protein CRUP_024398 [Coryphaenoides rupestris]|nr:hypothetical protein CRUP_024398 [Coryphaenoides rupestris]
MCGIDVHMDPNIGKRLNALGNTLTSLTGEEDTEDIAERTSPMADLSDEDDTDTMSPTIHMEPVDPRRQMVMGNQAIDARGRKFTKRLVDIRELNEQAKVIDDLKKLGASEGTINQEIERYQQLESVAVNDIRRDVRKKLRRSSMRAASLKDKWGLGYKPSYNRSKSISAAAGRPPPKKIDRQSSKIADLDDLPDIRMEASSPGPRVTFNIQDTHDGGHHQGELSSSSSEDTDKDEDYERKSSGFAAVSQLFSERWPSTPSSRSFLSPPIERNIDFELDVRVEIDSGKCVLHPTTSQPEHEDVSFRRSCDRSLRSLDQESPPKKKKLQPAYSSTSHLLTGKKCPSTLQTKSNDLETTIFYIPGVDVKGHTSQGRPGDLETLLVEYHLIPDAANSHEEDMGQFEPVESLEESATSLVSSSTSAYSSFPVDVVVYVRVQPSQIRFSCLPMSRVECMLKLPSLDLVFSSNRGELEVPAVATHPSDGQNIPPCTPPGQQIPKPPPNKGTVDEEASSVTGRKDSLSINLEFVKVSLSRMRRTGGPTFIESFIPTKCGKMDTTLINISAVCDIGSASFKYDMRRLSEILAFPRAWYRRSIARRLFLGDQTINLPASGPATPDSSENTAQHPSPESTRKAYWRTWDGSTGGHGTPSVFSDHPTGTNMSPGGFSHLKSPAPGRTRSVSDSSAPRRDSVTKTSTPSSTKNGKTAGQQGTPWETLVVFAINLKQLNVQMNMSNVMGNNTWTTSGLKSQGRLSVGSNRDREISMSVGLGRSKLDSKGGVVGGNIDVNTLEMVSHISEHPNQQPSHKIQITMGSTEARVDYMGSSILMGVFSNADLKLQDEWKVNLNTVDASLSEKSEIFIHGDLQWDIFQVIISRSTTPDLIKIGMKLQEFFTQQFDTSKRALSTWGPGSYLPPKTPVINIEKGATELYLDAAHHRHWPGVLKVIAGCHISLFQVPLPEDAVQLGGSMSLHGNHMTLACFHGPNFRSKSWALFHLEEPNIAFWTEAQKILEDGSNDDSTYIVQTLDFHLGHNTMVTKPCGALESPMATITKITRRRHENPPHGVATVKEWFNYVTAMRNEDSNSKPKVECSVVTEFTDHICVTMDAELIMFLHDLVSAYLKEKEKALFAPRIFAMRPGQKSPTTMHDESSSDKEQEEGINYTTVDWREFMCNTWHLEPTLRTTIPKWLQRGVMDPLDKVLSVLIKKLGTALQDEKEKKGRDKDDH